MGLEAPSHWIIIALIVVALFGYKKMPDAARSIGKSLRIFKTEIKEMTGNDASAETVPPPAPVDSVKPVTTTTVETTAVNGVAPDGIVTT